MKKIQVSNSTSVSDQYKCYSHRTSDISSVHDMAITCNRCRQPLLVEFDTVTEESIAYELTDLSQEQKKIVHKHQCNQQLKNSVVNAVAVEKWCLYEQNRTFKN